MGPVGAHVGRTKICAECGHAVEPGDRYCSGCGAAFPGAPTRTDHVIDRPGFSYLVRQGLAWGIGFSLAGATVTLLVLLVIGLATRGLR